MTLRPKDGPVSKPSHACASIIDASLAAIRKRPDDASTWVDLALAYCDDGKRELAIRTMVRALELDPESLPIVLDAAVTLSEEDCLDRSIPMLEAVTRFAPDNSTGWSALGSAYFGERNFVEATRAFEVALNLNPDRARFHYNAGIGHEGQGHYAIALAHMQRALALDPGNTHFMHGCARLHGLMRNFEASIAGYRQVLALNPNDGWAVLGIATAHIEMGDLRAAIREHATLRRLDPQLAEQLARWLPAAGNA